MAISKVKRNNKKINIITLFVVVVCGSLLQLLLIIIQEYNYKNDSIYRKQQRWKRILSNDNNNIITQKITTTDVIEYNLGNGVFVQIDENERIQILTTTTTMTINSTNSNNSDRKVVWTSYSPVFLRAEKAVALIKDSRGIFKVRDSIEKTTDDVTIDSIELIANTDNDNITDNATNTTATTTSLILSGRLERIKQRFFIKLGWTVEADYKFTISILSNQQIELSVQLFNTDYNRIKLIYESNNNEKFYGFGEQFTYLNMKGQKLQLYTNENGIGRGNSGGEGPKWFNVITDIIGISGEFHSTYAPMPYYLTDTNYAYFLKNYEISEFDLRKDNCISVKVYGTNIQSRLLVADTPLELIELYTEYTGRMKPLPDWFNNNGAVIGMQGGTERVLEIYNQLQKLETPISAFWLQDWVGKRQTTFGSQLWWNWDLDEERYPNWTNLINTLNKTDIRVMVYVSPYLVEVPDNYKGEKLFNIAKERGYLVLDKNGEIFFLDNTTFSAAIIDITNPEARIWFKEVIKRNVINIGVSGWMQDFGEGLPFDGILYSGVDANIYHNKYPEEYNKLTKEAIDEVGRTDDIVVFSRSGFTQSPGSTQLLWEGDQFTLWNEHDGLKSAITGLLSSGISGFSINHNDIGGFYGISFQYLINLVRTRELFLRWTEMNAFTPVYRTHEGITPDKNVQFYTDDETLYHFSKFAKIYTALADYRILLMDEAHEKGYPLVRHPFLHFPNDLKTYEIRYQWMLGSEFMIVPVTEPDVVTVDAYLPGNNDIEWIHVWTQENYPGGIEYIIDAPIGMPAVFYRAGSIVGQSFVNKLIGMGIL